MSTSTLRLLIVILLLIMAAPLVTVAEGPSILVRDSRGKLVGVVLAETRDLASTEGLTDKAPLWVARKLSGKWIFLQVTKEAVRGTKDMTPFLYENNLCIGPPLLDAPAGNSVRPTVIFDTKVYWSAEAGSERVIRSQGVLMHEADKDKCGGTLLDGNLCCTVPDKEETRLAGETVSVDIAALNLHPPFSLEVVPVQAPAK